MKKCCPSAKIRYSESIAKSFIAKSFIAKKFQGQIRGWHLWMVNYKFYGGASVILCDNSCLYQCEGHYLVWRVEALSKRFPDGSSMKTKACLFRNGKPGSIDSPFPFCTGFPITACCWRTCYHCSLANKSSPSMGQAAQSYLSPMLSKWQVGAEHFGCHTGVSCEAPPKWCLLLLSVSIMIRDHSPLQGVAYGRGGNEKVGQQGNCLDLQPLCAAATPYSNGFPIWKKLKH